MLAYGDDIVLAGESANELQTLLNILWKWCSEWGMYAKGDKTQIVHFRKLSISKAIYGPKYMHCE